MILKSDMSKIYKVGQEGGNSGKIWYYSLKYKFHRAAGWKVRWGFCVTELRQSFFFGKVQSLLWRPSTNWMNSTPTPTWWRVICFGQSTDLTLITSEKCLCKTSRFVFDWTIGITDQSIKVTITYFLLDQTIYFSCYYLF